MRVGEGQRRLHCFRDGRKTSRKWTTSKKLASFNCGFFVKAILRWGAWCSWCYSRGSTVNSCFNYSSKGTAGQPVPVCLALWQHEEPLWCGVGGLNKREFWLSQVLNGIQLRATSVELFCFFNIIIYLSARQMKQKKTVLWDKLVHFTAYTLV